ncbi:stage II sporulation protein R [Methylomusa anaerophila]|uniref:Stage II sporulation protein R n=2 Tax=Methylomusa anaerophila TaxID=1930071 RepID=A0A348AQA2_9FIRM|nr:stage II sporulation protein R [Methylomusa anaerophila]BBB93250.1 Stage II sporulation protein R [Methylomusa anaerophila]
MSKIFLLGLLFLFVAGGWGMLALYESRSTITTPNRNDYVRLHILANSDSLADQQMKLKVRDAVIAYLTPLVKNVKSAEDANSIILAHQGDIIKVAKQVVSVYDVEYPVTVQIGQFNFPVKSYGNLTLPAGQYQAVRILIGKAEGQNWWCVLFPPLCFIDGSKVATAPISGTSDDNNDKQPKIEIRWKITELLSSLSK